MLEMKRLQDGKQKSALLTELGVDTSEVFVYAAYEGGIKSAMPFLKI